MAIFEYLFSLSVQGLQEEHEIKEPQRDKALPVEALLLQVLHALKQAQRQREFWEF